MKAGGAALLGAVAAPLAALIPLINTGPGRGQPMRRACWREAREKPLARRRADQRRDGAR